MDNNKFFKLVWRANALLILGAALLAFIVLLFAITDWRVTNLPPIAADLPVEASEMDYELRLRSLNTKNVDGFAYFEVSAGETNLNKFSSYSYSHRQTRNLLVFNLETNETRWVFPTSRQEIQYNASIQVRERNEFGESVLVTRGFLLTVATRNSEGAVTTDVWVMSVSGEDVRKVLSGVAGRVDLKLYADNDIKTIVETDGKIDMYSMDVSTLTLGDKVTIKIP